MDSRNFPEFKRFDLAEIFFKEEFYGKGQESVVRYLVSLKNDETFKEGYVEACERIAGGTAVFPQKFNLKNLEKIVVYKRDSPMEGSKEINELVDKYLEQIKVEGTDFVPVDDTASDAADLLLNIPTSMLKEYMRIKGKKGELPDGVEFWKETGLCKRLRKLNNYHGEGHEPLGDILEFLEIGVGVQASYQKLDTPDRIRLNITEIMKID